MAKKRKGGYRRKGKKKSKKSSTPRSVSGVWRAQPLLVKGGMALTALEIGTSSANKYSTSLVTAIKAKDYDGALRVLKENMTEPRNYKPVVYGVIGHYINKKVVHIKGL